MATVDAATGQPFLDIDASHCPNCGEINDRKIDMECTACGWVLVAWQCAKCKHANDAYDWPICNTNQDDFVDDD